MCKIRSCLEIFSTAEELARHEREPHYKCDCGAAFFTKFELVRHKREDPCDFLVCDKCDINFFDADPASRHQYAKSKWEEPSRPFNLVSIIFIFQIILWHVSKTNNSFVINVASERIHPESSNLINWSILPSANRNVNWVDSTMLLELRKSESILEIFHVTFPCVTRSVATRTLIQFWKTLHNRTLFTV